MFHQSINRNHRSKGSHVKKILQVVVLLAVACWLLYQVKHSHEKKKELTGNDDIKLSKLGGEIYLGRKGDAGSENVVIIDTNAESSEESTEIKQDEVQHDASVLNNEGISKDVPHSHELAHPQESKQERHAYSHADDGEDVLLLPSEEGVNNSTDQNDNSNEGGNKDKENEHLNGKIKHEDIKSDVIIGDGVEVAMTSSEIISNSIQAKSSKNTGKDNEETSGEAGSEEISMNDEVSEGKGIGSYEHSSNNVDDRVRDYPSSDDAHISSSQGYATATNDQVDNEFHEQRDVDTKNEASKEEDVETQLGSSLEVENKDNSSGEMKTDRESEKVMKNSFSQEEPRNSSDTSSEVDRTFIDSHADKASELRSTSEANNNVAVELQANNGDSDEAEDSQNHPFELRNITDSPEKWISTKDTVEFRENGDEKSDENSGDAIDKEGSIATGGGKNEAALNDEATSLEVNEKVNLEDSTRKIPAGKVVQAEEGSSSDAESIHGSNDDKSETEQSSHMETQQQGDAAEQKAVE